MWVGYKGAEVQLQNFGLNLNLLNWTKLSVGPVQVQVLRPGFSSVHGSVRY